MNGRAFDDARAEIFQPDRSSADCEAARVMTMVLPVSAILGDFGKNFSGSHREQLLAEFQPKLDGLVGFGPLSSSEMTRRPSRLAMSPLIVSRSCWSVAFPGNRHLAASAERSKQSAFGGDGRPRGSWSSSFEKVSRRIVG